MSRWEPDAALRLQRAALELFSERGYAATTVPEITARAGLTTRTFYLHFIDKREVLFLREREFPSIVSTLLAEAPPALAPLDLVMHGFEAVAGSGFDLLRSDLRLRRAVIRSEERLRERELLKSAALAEAIEAALIADGVDASTASPAAAYGVMLFDMALSEWLDGDADAPLLEVLRSTRARMQVLVAL